MLHRPAGAITGIRVPARIIAARRRALPRQRLVVPIVAVAVAVIAAAAAGVVVTHPGLMHSGGPRHKVEAPGSLLSFTQEPTLSQDMHASALKSQIMRKANGEARNVVDAVYVDHAGKNPLIILFIGGNMAGSATSIISSFTDMLPGAFPTRSGPLGGRAACVPSSPTRPAALCAWADDDTFGLFSSTTMSASALGAQMLAMRPLLEHLRKNG